MKFLTKKVIVMMLAMSLAVFPSLQANAQAGAGTIAGLSTTSAIVVGITILGAGFLIAEAIDDDPLLPPQPTVVVPTTTTTTPPDTGSSSTTTTN